MMRILITGGAGFIGRHIAEYFHHQADVRVLDNLRSGSAENLAGLSCQLVVGSILNRKLVRESIAGVDVVFHLAAMASVPESIAKPDECAEINFAGTKIVLEEAAKAGVKKLIFSSSAAIYGDTSAGSRVETMAAEPKSPYAATKYESEQLCGSFTDQGLLATVCLRYFNVFGPSQLQRGHYAAVIPLFVQNAMRHEPITIFGDGRQTRDFVYVSDVVAANAFFAFQCPATGIFNVASGKETSITELALTISKLTHSSSAICYAAERASDVRCSGADLQKLYAAGFKPVSDLAGGLGPTIDFFTRRTQNV